MSLGHSFFPDYSVFVGAKHVYEQWLKRNQSKWNRGDQSCKNYLCCTYIYKNIYFHNLDNYKYLC